MTHLVEMTRPGRVPTKWLKVNSQVHTLVVKWAKRDDLTVAMSEEAGRGQAPALFDPQRLAIEVNTKAAFGKRKPDTIGDLNIRSVQFEHQKASGAIFHEASHARFTTWSLVDSMKDLTPAQNDALHLLEEGRIEGLGARYNPENKPFLRACALEIVMGDMKDEKVKKMSGKRKMARLAALVLGRKDAGVLKEEDVKRFREPIYDALGKDVVETKLRPIWQEFQTITAPDRDLKRMYRLAKEWAAILDEEAKDEDKAQQEAMQRAQDMADALGDAIGDMIGDMISEQMGDTEISAQSDAYDQERQEIQDEKRKEKEARAKEQGENKKASEQIFEKPKPPEGKRPSVGSRSFYGETNHRMVEKRSPSAEERQAAIQIGKALEKAKYHDRIRIERNSEVPPGRLRTRAAVQNAAFKSLGMRNQAEPFRRVQRKHEVDPNLTVGVMTDISGSMTYAMEPMGVTGWIMSEAVRRIQGTIAMVNYGHEAVPTLKPGEHMKDVQIYNAPDMSEAFNDGFKALDGRLNMLNGSGARLLVIVSDGNYRPHEIEHCKRWLKRCADEGVAVLWLGYANPEGAKNIIRGLPVEFVIPEKTALGTAKLVGQAAIRALAVAGAGDK